MAESTTLGLSRCAQPEPTDATVLEMVRAAVDAVGGIRRFVRPGDLVVLKPNQTVWFTAKDGVTTDPRVVAAMVTLCREAEAGHVVVGDSSGGDVRTSRVMEVTGVKRLAEQAGADEVVGFEDVPQDEVLVQVGGETHWVKIPKVMLDAQVVVNLPKAKVHFEDLVSCALKNWVGIVYQKERPRIMSDPLLAEVTAALHRRVPAQLTVVDGLWAGQGDGPVALEGAWLGCVLAGTDPVAVDATVARLLGFDPMGLTFAREAERIGLGTRDASRIRIVGPGVEEARIRATPTRPGFDHLPIRVLLGEGVTFAGSAGHVKSIADLFQKYGFWDAIQAVEGPVTIMIGRVEDPQFEAYVEEGPYIVVDDAALDRYKRDPRVEFVPGSPATHNIFPHLWRKLRLEHLGPWSMKFESYVKQTQSWFHDRRWSVPPPVGREVEGR